MSILKIHSFVKNYPMHGFIPPLNMNDTVCPAYKNHIAFYV